MNPLRWLSVSLSHATVEAPTVLSLILAAAKIADGSIPTNHNKFSMASARYKVNHAVSKRLLTFFLAMMTHEKGK